MHFEGTGIGLAICRKIVSNHRGIIVAEGEENKGSKFIVIFPLI
jgi:signal transduction histidine kinase